MVLNLFYFIGDNNEALFHYIYRKSYLIFKKKSTVCYNQPFRASNTVDNYHVDPIKQRKLRRKMVKKIICVLISALLVILFFGCTSPGGGSNDGTLTVSCEDMAVGNGHSLSVIVFDGINPVAASNPAAGIVAFGEATVDLLDFAMQPWVGTGGKTYTLVVAIDMDDDGVIGGDLGDYDVVPDPDVTINGDIAVTYDDNDFVLQ
jgi:hypothetical protein